jgi:hypothetical protein
VKPYVHPLTPLEKHVLEELQALVSNVSPTAKVDVVSEESLANDPYAVLCVTPVNTGAAPICIAAIDDDELELDIGGNPSLEIRSRGGLSPLDRALRIVAAIMKNGAVLNIVRDSRGKPVKYVLSWKADDGRELRSVRRYLVLSFGRKHTEEIRYEPYA